MIIACILITNYFSLILMMSRFKVENWSSNNHLKNFFIFTPPFMMLVGKYRAYRAITAVNQWIWNLYVRAQFFHGHFVLFFILRSWIGTRFSRTFYPTSSVIKCDHTNFKNILDFHILWLYINASSYVCLQV